eukprot:CAMPEP_0118954994 /NCGR_PEP_ID=MMETSP1169-20130426/59299_1 /TAXON_ID=36882 /ORGANISM="Pyramimonas obovata, Strain CCMP722" /LENGTH=42 /DNA_ID= /DNA_START= /DNA_END= /DNA_ORIENTATION=
MFNPFPLGDHLKGEEDARALLRGPSIRASIQPSLGQGTSGPR